MSGPLRILVVANLPPYVLGGAENQVARLVEAWSDLGHHVEVAGHRIPDGCLHLGAAAIPIHRIAVINRLGRSGRAISYFFSLGQLLGRISRKFDVVYCRGLGDGAISITLLKAIGWLRLPLVACPINARGAGDARFIRSIPGWRRIVTLINKHCEAINIIAPAIKPDLAALGIAGPRLSYIPNGIPLAPPVERVLVTPIRRLVWTGRLSPREGARRPAAGISPHCGGRLGFQSRDRWWGSRSSTLTALCRRLGLDNRVVFAGAVSPVAIRDRLAAADVFVLPSRYEGMSNAGLEAMEAGLPLVLTRCGGLDTYVDADIGWRCDPGDVDGLITALLAMLDTPDSKLLAMGRQARTRVERDFEIGTIGRHNAELLASVVEATSREGA